MRINIKDYIVPLIIVLSVTIAFNYFIGNKLNKESQQTDQIRSGERLIVPSSPAQIQPINTEIDFIDTKSSRKTELETIDTPLAHYQFTNDGATLNAFEFKHHVNSKERPLSTILPAARLVKEERCFLVALNQKTPYYFTLASRKDDEQKVVLDYHADFGDGKLTKQFTVYKNTFKIDIDLTLDPYHNKEVQARVLVLSPRVPELVKTDTISLLVNKFNAPAKLEQVSQSESMFQAVWIAPTLFGLEDRYFVHGLVGDPQGFAQRGFVKQWNTNGLLSFIEGPVVTKKQTWKLSFYVGPKEVTAMSAVDSRLPQILNYGWFDSIARLLLYILRFIAQYVHNFGLAIIILTLIIRALMAPFMAKSTEGMKKQQEFAKKDKYLQQKFKDDPERLRQERAELVKRHGMPGASGCLPLLLQIPIFMALYRVLAVSLELYQAPFLWISDLSAKDPYYIMPLLTGVAILLSSPTSDPKQRITMLIVALFSAVFMSTFSAGVLLYIFVTSIFSVFQNFIQKRIGKA